LEKLKPCRSYEKEVASEVTVCFEQCDSVTKTFEKYFISFEGKIAEKKVISI